jgi:hypothetical protein
MTIVAFVAFRMIKATERISDGRYSKNHFSDF